jgi:glutamyl-tRNA reductase
VSILVVSVSHKSTSVSDLAQLALDAPASAKLAEHLVGSEHIDEAVVLSTCNRTSCMPRYPASTVRWMMQRGAC